MRLTLGRPLLLRGKIVQPDGTGLDRYVLVRDGLIESVSRRRPPLAGDGVYIEAGVNDWIFPGLIDLHTHTDYNVLPIWEAKNGPFKNRFQWRDDESYKQEVRGVFGAIKQNRSALAVFAELQAIAGGTTTIQESQPLERNRDGTSPVLCRGTADARDLGLKGDSEILSVVDFFRPNKAGDKALPTNQIDAYVKAREQKRLQATLVHLAEGSSGFGGAAGCDDYSRVEFETLMAHPAFQNVEAVRSSSLAFVHCSGINADDPRHVGFMRERNISVIWSPVSNLLLYQDTLDVQKLIARGINVALGSDWSPSGSKHLWEEVKFARFYFDAIGSPVSDGELFEMVTTNAARCLGMNNIGRIDAGCLADFFILRSPIESDTALEVFFKTTDRHVRAVIIGGRPIYGAREFLQRFDLELQNLPPKEGQAVADKAVHLPARLKVNIERDFDALEKTLKGLGQKRNNLLADADTPYRQKINRLRQKIMSYGWQIQTWRRKEQRKRGSVFIPSKIVLNPNVKGNGLLIDLSHTIEHGMVTYKGLPPPLISDHLSREESRTRYESGTEFHIGKIEMVANTGTYLDSPFHRYVDGADLSALSLNFLANLDGIVIRHLGSGQAITAAVLEKLEIKDRAVLFHTGWDMHWRTEQYSSGQHPFLAADAAEYLANAGAALVGIDSYNIDDITDGSRPAHSTLLAHGIPIVEHLCGLRELPDAGFRFFAVPVKVKHFGTFPVRAFAIVPDN